MECYLLGNMDIRLILISEELSLVEKLINERAKKQKIASVPIKAPNSTLDKTEFQLIYDPSRQGDCGVDASEVLAHFNKPPIQVYISKRAIPLLKEQGWCGTAYSDAKLEIRMKKSNI